MTAKSKRSLAAKARKHLRAREEGSSHYKRADRLLREMRDAGLKPGDEIPLNAAGDKFVLEDLYANQDKVFRSHGIGRFEIRVIARSA